MKPTNIRDFVFKQIFFYGYYDHDSFDKQCEIYLEDEALSANNKSYLKERATSVIRNIDEIDKKINGASSNWSTGRMGKVDLAILRLAVYEMFYDENIPISVAIDEAVELAKKYGDKDSYSFVNGVLGKLAKEV